jgi:hypothetical protein
MRPSRGVDSTYAESIEVVHASTEIIDPAMAHFARFTRVRLRDLPACNKGEAVCQLFRQNGFSLL